MMGGAGKAAGGGGQKHAEGANEAFDVNRVKVKALCQFESTSDGSTRTLEGLKDWAPQGLDSLLDGTNPDEPLQSMFESQVKDQRDPTNREHLTAAYIRHADPKGTTSQKTVHWLNGEYAKQFRAKHRGDMILENLAYYDCGAEVFGISEIVFNYQKTFDKTKPSALERARKYSTALKTLCYDASQEPWDMGPTMEATVRMHKIRLTRCITEDPSARSLTVDDSVILTRLQKTTVLKMMGWLRSQQIEDLQGCKTLQNTEEESTDGYFPTLNRFATKKKITAATAEDEDMPDVPVAFATMHGAYDSTASPGSTHTTTTGNLKRKKEVTFGSAEVQQEARKSDNPDWRSKKACRAQGPCQYEVKTGRSCRFRHSEDNQPTKTTKVSAKLRLGVRDDDSPSHKRQKGEVAENSKSESIDTLKKMLQDTQSQMSAFMRYHMFGGGAPQPNIMMSQAALPVPRAPHGQAPDQSQLGETPPHLMSDGGGMQPTTAGGGGMRPAADSETAEKLEPAPPSHTQWFQSPGPKWRGPTWAGPGVNGFMFMMAAICVIPAALAAGAPPIVANPDALDKCTPDVRKILARSGMLCKTQILGGRRRAPTHLHQFRICNASVGSSDDKHDACPMVDSGGNVHATGDKTTLRDYKVVKVCPPIKCADGAFVQVLGHGTLIIRTYDSNNKPVRIRLTNVLHAAGLTRTIVSPQQLSREGIEYKVQRWTGKGYLETYDGIKVPLTTQDGLHVIRHPTSDRPTVAIEGPCINATARVKYGHELKKMSEDDLLTELKRPETFRNRKRTRMVREALVDNFHILAVPSPLNSPALGIHSRFHCSNERVAKLWKRLAPENKRDSVYLRWCEACLKTKSTRKRQSRHRIDYTKVPPGKMWCSDVAGPFPIASKYHGYRYEMCFVDCHSSTVLLIGLKNLTEITKGFQEFSVWVRKHYHGQVTVTPQGGGTIYDPTKHVRVKTDCARYYKSRALRGVCANYKIELESSPPYHQAVNGIAERMWRTLHQIGASGRTAADRPANEWYFSHQWAAAGHDVLPSTATPTGGSPRHARTGSEPSKDEIFETIYPYGARCCVHRHGRHPKLASKGRMGYWIGFDKEARAHICLLPAVPATDLEESKKEVIVCSVDVQIDKSAPVPIRTGKVALQQSLNTDFDWPQQSVEQDTTVEPGGEIYDFGGLETQAGGGLQIDSDSETAPMGETGQVHDFGWENDSTLDESQVENEPQEDTIDLAAEWPDRYSTSCEPVMMPTIYLSIGNTHGSLKTAMRDDMHVPHAVKACNAEWNQLINTTKCLVPVPRSSVPYGTRIYDCFMIMNLKANADGTVKKGKARAVVDGRQFDFVQDRDRKAHMPSSELNRAFIAKAAALGRTVYGGDCPGAYLNYRLKGHEIYYLHPPRDQRQQFLLPNGDSIVFRVEGGLYGDPRAGRWWMATLANWLTTSQGFTRSCTDPSLYTRNLGQHNEILMTIHCDDSMVQGGNDEDVQKFLRDMNDRWGDCGFEPAAWILGMNVVQTKEGIWIGHTTFVKQMLDKLEMSNLKPTSTPFPPGEKVDKRDCPLTPNKERKQRMQQIVGALTWLSCQSRPDISWAVSQLARVASNPSEVHMQLATHVCAYVSGTQDRGIQYYRQTTKLQLITYSDSGWSDIPGGVGDTLSENPDGRKSSEGYIAMVAGGAIAWQSHKSDCVCLSSCEAELVASVRAGKSMKFLRNLLKDMDEEQAKPSPLFMDNLAAVLINNTEGHLSQRTRHIDNRWFWIQTEVAEGRILVRHCPGSPTDTGLGNPSDMLTKALPTPRHWFYANALTANRRHGTGSSQAL